MQQGAITVPPDIRILHQQMFVARPERHGTNTAVNAYATRLTVTQHGDLMTKPTVVRKKCVKVQVTMTPILAVAVVLRKIPNTITT